jgi:hypothetical protein
MMRKVSFMDILAVADFVLGVVAVGLAMMLAGTVAHTQAVASFSLKPNPAIKERYVTLLN